MFSRFRYWRARVTVSILILALFTSCSAVDLSAVLGGASTPTADPTLLAVPVMLTQTAAAEATEKAATLTPTPTSTPTPNPTVVIPETGSQEAPAVPGQKIQTGTYTLFILPPKLLQAVGTHKTSPGRAYLDIQTVMQNTGSKPVPYAPLFFHLSELSALKNKGSASSATLQPVSVNNSQTPALLSGDLAPGESVRGHLFFDVPEKGASYAIRFDPQGNGASSVWVDLTQPASSNGLPTTEATGSWPGLGKRVEKNGEALTVQSITARKTYGRYKPVNGNLFVELDVIIENVSLTSVSYNADYFRIKDSLGYEYTSTVIPSETLLMAGSLTEDRQISGHVIFEIPTNLKRVVVSYQPLVIGQEFEPIRIQVELPSAR